MEKYLNTVVAKGKKMTLEQAKYFAESYMLRNPVIKKFTEKMVAQAAKYTEAMAKRTGGTAGKGLGKKIGKAIPFVGIVVAAWFWNEDVEAKGLSGGTLNTVLDAIPGIGTAKLIDETLIGPYFFPDDGPWVPDR